MLAVLLAQTAQSATPLVDISNQAGFGKLASGDLSTMISGAFDMALAAGAILAVMRISYAGWLYMGWSDSVSEKQAAKQTFSDAVLGLILLYSIYLVLFQINPCLLKIRLFNPNDSGDCKPTN